MKIVYLSVSGNVRNFVSRLNAKKEDLIELDENSVVRLQENEKFIIIAPTYDPPITDPLFDFLEDNNPENCVGVVGSGNLNFGTHGYCYTARDLANQFNVKQLLNFEYTGFDNDVEFVNNIITEET